MKKMIATFLVLASVSGFAKMSVYNAQHALDLVAKNDQVLETILKKSKTTKILNIDAEQVGFNEFEVVVTSGKAKRSCDTLVAVKSVNTTVTLPGGGKITANKLTITNVSKSVCE